MRSFIRLDFLANGTNIVALANPLVVNSVVSEPDITDAFEVVAEAVSAAYQFFFGDKKKAAEEAVKFVSDVVNGKDVKNVRTMAFVFTEGGKIPFLLDFTDPLNPGNPTVDEMIVLFRAFSDDDLTKSFGRVDQTNDSVPIADLGGRFFSEGDNKFFEQAFSVPLARLPVGDYVFAFASGDDGLFFDVGVASTLRITVAADPNKAPAGVSQFMLDPTLAASLITANIAASRSDPTVPRSTTPRPSTRSITFVEAVNLPFKTGGSIRAGTPTASSK